VDLPRQANVHRSCGAHGVAPARQRQKLKLGRAQAPQPIAPGPGPQPPAARQARQPSAAAGPRPKGRRWRSAKTGRVAKQPRNAARTFAWTACVVSGRAERASVAARVAAAPRSRRNRIRPHAPNRCDVVRPANVSMRWQRRVRARVAARRTHASTVCAARAGARSVIRAHCRLTKVRVRRSEGKASAADVKARSAARAPARAWRSTKPSRGSTCPMFPARSRTQSRRRSPSTLQSSSSRCA